MLTKETTSTLTSDPDSLHGRYGSQGRRLSLLLRPRSSPCARSYHWLPQILQDGVDMFVIPIRTEDADIGH